MSASKKEKLQLSWGAAIFGLLLANLFGTIDIRGILNSVKALPLIQAEQARQAVEQTRQAEEILHIKEVLKRNNLGSAEPPEMLSTASYE